MKLMCGFSFSVKKNLGLSLMDLINDSVMNSAFMDSDSVLFELLEEKFEN